MLAFAYKEFKAEKELELSDEEGLVFLGLISMMDPPREEAAAAVRLHILPLDFLCVLPADFPDAVSDSDIADTSQEYINW